MSHTNVTLGTTHTSHQGAEFGQYTFVLDRDKERHMCLNVAQRQRTFYTIPSAMTSLIKFLASKNLGD